ncbi:hypothetical protein K443DRAFT_134591 [Laccaria amethystina LaAM-08-1]|uniref:Plectin/eS10 N-terminal domain-containing protein n=1 Tax=Laccaria amethystina LaAM-08-1 TaxID=1095629 RepID=A0A0C9WJK2_9AGAR|nr:hypothetical protein K443DRAFT_134591 [Laccaria amethystina LaAM-08-1]
MIISKQNRGIISRTSSRVLAKKDFNALKHEELNVPNLEDIKALQSLTSRGYVKTQFLWQWYYYVLTPEVLHLPTEIVPNTHRKATRPPRPATIRPGGAEGAYRAPRGDREWCPDKFRPQSAGVGRGGPRE